MAATDRTLRTNAQTIDRAIRSIMLSGEAPIAVRTIRSLQEIQGLEQIDLYRTNGMRIGAQGTVRGNRQAFPAV